MRCVVLALEVGDSGIAVIRLGPGEVHELPIVARCRDFLLGCQDLAADGAVFAGSKPGFGTGGINRSVNNRRMGELLDRLCLSAQFFVADGAVDDLVVTAFRAAGRRNFIFMYRSAGRMCDLREFNVLRLSLKRFIFKGCGIGADADCGAGGRSRYGIRRHSRLGFDVAAVVGADAGRGDGTVVVSPLVLRLTPVVVGF